MLAIPKIIGHRGACRYAPENTLASLRKAAELGATWIELDVMLTQDEEAIVFHDETLDRTTNGHGLVAQTPYAVISELDAGSWFSPKFTGEKIPTFEAYLDAATQAGLGMNIEIKPNPGQDQKTAEKVVAILQRRTSIPPLLISSFSVEALQVVHALNKTLPLGLLLDKWIEGWREIAMQLDCVSVNLDRKLVTPQKVQEIKALGVPYVLAYTVNDKDHAAALFAMGVDAVFSDAPDMFGD